METPGPNGISVMSTNNMSYTSLFHLFHFVTCKVKRCLLGFRFGGLERLIEVYKLIEVILQKSSQLQQTPKYLETCELEALLQLKTVYIRCLLLSGTFIEDTVSRMLSRVYSLDVCEKNVYNTLINSHLTPIG